MYVAFIAPELFSYFVVSSHYNNEVEIEMKLVS